MTRTLVVTNDFPPRPGGVQAFVLNLVTRLPAGDVVVYTSRWGAWQEHDAALPFPVVREDTGVLLPTPRVRRRAAALAAQYGCQAALFGATAPLALMAPDLRAAGVRRVVSMMHGHENGWAMLPGARQLLRRIGDDVDALTYLAEYTRDRVAPVLSAAAATRMVRVPPGVDERQFRPGAGGAGVRAALGLGERPVVVCVSRLVRRKGQDVLVRAWPQVLRQVPDAVLLLVGGGPLRGRLERAVEQAGLRSSVRFTGSVPWAALPAHYDAGDVFAMPCRTRWGGMDVEGLGIVFLEASATGLPVVAGDSGGAPDAVLDGETGYVVDGRSVAEVADRLVGLLLDRELARRMGERGRAWVQRSWRWDTAADRLRALLDGELRPGRPSREPGQEPSREPGQE